MALRLELLLDLPLSRNEFSHQVCCCQFWDVRNVSCGSKAVTSHLELRPWSRSQQCRADQIQLSARSIIEVAAVCAQSPWAISNRSGFQRSNFSRAARALLRLRKLARHSRGVLPFSPTRPSSRISMPFQPVMVASGWRWIRSQMIAVRDR